MGGGPAVHPPWRGAGLGGQDRPAPTRPGRAEAHGGRAHAWRGRSSVPGLGAGVAAGVAGVHGAPRARSGSAVPEPSGSGCPPVPGALPVRPRCAPVAGAGATMPSSYPQRALTVLLLFGTLSAAMALLASSLIFQLPAGRTGPGPGPGPGRGALPEAAAAALLPVSAVLAALCLVLNVSCLLLCLLHGYFSTELCRGQAGTDR